MKLRISLCMLFCSCASVLAGGRPESQIQVGTFFKDLSEKGGVAAMKELSEGTLFANRQGVQLEASAAQLDTAIKMYGEISRIESVEKKNFGESFVRLRSISYHASGGALFWEFMFYRPKNEWQIHSIRFNDQFHRAFGESP